MPFPIWETLVRIVVPLSIFRWPLVGILVSNLADMYDWKFVRVQNEKDLGLYQTWDKAMDLYYHTVILLVVLRFKDKVFKKTAVLLFFIRVVGDTLFFSTSNRNFLLFFPNVFENFVIFYLFYKWVGKKDILFRNKRVLVLVLTVILVPKLIHEYFLHYLLIQPWQWLNFGKMMGFQGIIEEYTNYLVWGSALYLIPMGVTLLYLLKKRN